MSSASDIQALLRFLSQDAKIPLATAMGKVKELQQAGLGSPDTISKSNVEEIKKVFSDEKLSKQVFNAAKRMSKKRASISGTFEPPAKKQRPAAAHELGTPAAFEASLELPEPCPDEDQIRNIVLITNRAPLVLAFVVTLLKYTRPKQPLSSRLSLAQAVVSTNARSKAVSIGIESGKSAEDEGWGEGQPIVKIMGREIHVMKRWGYEWKEEVKNEVTENNIKTEEAQEPDSPETLKGNADPPREQEPALWGVDLEALKKSNGPKAATSGLPIYTAQSARSYLLRSFEIAPNPKEEKRPKKQTAAAKQAEKEHAVSLLLGALDLLYQSWSGTLDRSELDKRAWSWYVAVRPDVASGASGWGARNEVKLAAILDLRRKQVD